MNAPKSCPVCKSQRIITHEGVALARRDSLDKFAAQSYYDNAEVKTNCGNQDFRPR
jgi:hypothetical protein